MSIQIFRNFLLRNLIAEHPINREKELDKFLAGTEEIGPNLYKRPDGKVIKVKIV